LTLILAVVLFEFHELSLKLLDALTLAWVRLRCSVVTIPAAEGDAMIREVGVDPCAVPNPRKIGLNIATNAIVTTVRVL